MNKDDLTKTQEIVKPPETTSAQTNDTPENADDGVVANRTEKSQKKSSVWYWITDIAIALVLALIIAQFFSPTMVRQNSMEDTLHDGDYIFINKRVYSFTDVKHGDIVIFVTDEEDEDGNPKKLIKRAIALPGDTIEITDGKVYLNDEELIESYIKDGYTDGEIEKVTVPENKLFVMGDNRTYSHDSREQDIGFVDMDSLRGQAIFRLYPFGDIGRLK